MAYTPLTAFKRAVDATQLQRNQMQGAPLPPNGVNKWELMRELTTARAAFNVSDRDLAVLEALLSFHPATILGGNDRELIVHPSNASICERLKGMACSTMRRHLARLVEVGLILRRDSPNGKRYVRRTGGERQAFGFDLTPLILRHAEICARAETVRAATLDFKRLRETVSLMRRDLAGLASYGAVERPDLALWDQLSDLATLTARALRRKLDAADLKAIEAELLAALDKARTVLEPHGAENLSTSDAVCEQHHQNSNKDPYESELRLEKAKDGAVREKTVGSFETSYEELQQTQSGECKASNSTELNVDANLPNLPLGLVLSVCSQVQNYFDEPIRHWHHLVKAADQLRPMMGVSPSAWSDAKAAMGPEQASVVLAAMLERFAEIRSHGGYLRSLTLKAADGAFSCGPMVMALLRKAA